MDSILFIFLTVFSIALISFTSGYFYSSYRLTEGKVKDLRKQKEKYLDPLMSSNELSAASARFIRLRNKARKMRNTRTTDDST